MPQTASTSDKRTDDGSSKRPRRWLRPLVIVVAACVIALSGWSLAEYELGTDPLAGLLSQEALQTTAEPSDEGQADDNANISDDANEAAPQGDETGDQAAEADEGSSNADGASDAMADGASQDGAVQGDAGTSTDGSTTSGDTGGTGSSAPAATSTDTSSSSGAATSSTGGTSSTTPSSPSTGGSTQQLDSGQRDQAIAVSVTIDGSPAGGSRHGSTVEVAPGSTVYDALVAADSNINARDTIYGIYVAAIDGLAEKEHGSMSGWVYAVNGVEPNTACSNYVLSAGDTVVWTYVNVE